MLDTPLPGGSTLAALIASASTPPHIPEELFSILQPPTDSLASSAESALGASAQPAQQEEELCLTVQPTSPPPPPSNLASRPPIIPPILRGIGRGKPDAYATMYKDMKRATTAQADYETETKTETEEEDNSEDAADRAVAEITSNDNDLDEELPDPHAPDVPADTGCSTDSPSVSRPTVAQKAPRPEFLQTALTTVSTSNIHQGSSSGPPPQPRPTVAQKCPRVRQPPLIAQKSTPRPTVAMKEPRCRYPPVPDQTPPTSRHGKKRARGQKASEPAAKKSKQSRKSRKPKKKQHELHRNRRAFHRGDYEKICPPLVFARLIREICNKIFHKEHMRFQGSALAAIQVAAEAMLIERFECAGLLALHANRVTVIPMDTTLTDRLARFNLYNAYDMSKVAFTPTPGEQEAKDRERKRRGF